jgi:hypothetical protein
MTKIGWAAFCEVLEEETSLHRIYSRDMGFAHITDVNGVRHRLDVSMSYQDCEQSISRIKEINKRGRVRKTIRTYVR